MPTAITYATATPKAPVRPTKNGARRSNVFRAVRCHCLEGHSIVLSGPGGEDKVNAGYPLNARNKPGVGRMRPPRRLRPGLTARLVEGQLDALFGRPVHAFGVSPLELVVSQLGPGPVHVDLAIVHLGA